MCHASTSVSLSNKRITHGSGEFGVTTGTNSCLYGVEKSASITLLFKRVCCTAVNSVICVESAGHVIWTDTYLLSCCIWYTVNFLVEADSTRLAVFGSVAGWGILGSNLLHLDFINLPLYLNVELLNFQHAIWHLWQIWPDLVQNTHNSSLTDIKLTLDTSTWPMKV